MREKNSKSAGSFWIVFLITNVFALLALLVLAVVPNALTGKERLSMIGLWLFLNLGAAIGWQLIGSGQSGSMRLSVGEEKAEFDFKIETAANETSQRRQQSPPSIKKPPQLIEGGEPVDPIEKDEKRSVKKVKR